MDKGILKYFDEFFEILLPTLPYSQYGNLESAYLYGFLKEHNFKNIVEVGTEIKGRTSYIIQMAKGKAKHKMFDYADVLTLAFNNLTDDLNTDGVELFMGKFENTYKDIDWSEVDFLFIDADHERKFAKFYLDEVIPKLKPGTLVHVHDMNLYDDWKTGFYPNSEIEEFRERHKQGTLPLEKVEWIWDYCYNPEYKVFTNLLGERYPIGKFPLKEEPFGCSASYWRVK